ncbi:YtnP family quorum-quenching lactonase [Sporosarcina limicola]|uniref:Glyoxylase-like metal-dependent hydrolase (Beta-lactamase superfamily II) n=1 Tax=Sporosarcina limicola TaxID=34101 RepID=A0A927MJZ2_9BACL|nr:MBL fold metallo-hydrolase [Sporosarcina limicola]MBE1554352.1 glyoxylase-like metal-dependent hydrolase (beta-lactamase superfamily II) [Sporosarcina limicola]
MDTYTFHDMKLTWLDGGVNYLDGGTMFGVVPKALWSRRYEVDENNLIELRTDPIFIQYEGKNILIDTGIGKGKLTEKMRRNLGVREETKVEEELAKLGLKPGDIDIILMTHLHNDHAAGLTEWQGDKLVSVFSNADIYVSKIEWDEMRNPNIRSRNTYWKENWESVQQQITTFDGQLTVHSGIEMIHTGGHSEGHSIIKLTQNGETILHMGDIMPTHAHSNPLWVLAYDDYPMTSIFMKEKLMKKALPEGYKFIFYHDAFYRLVQWDESGKEIVDSVKRSR